MNKYFTIFGAIFNGMVACGLFVAAIIALVCVYEYCNVWCVCACVALVLAMCYIYCRKALKLRNEFEEEDNEDYEEDVIELNASDLNMILDYVGTHNDWNKVLEESKKLYNEYTYNKESKDEVLVDMRHEEKSLRKRLVGAMKVVIGDDFEKWSEADKVIMFRQLSSMYMYHAILMARCMRYGVLIEKGEANV